MIVREAVVHDELVRKVEYFVGDEAQERLEREPALCGEIGSNP